MDSSLIVEMKKSTVSQLFKQDNRDDSTNYRPISIVPYFSKLGPTGKSYAPKTTTIFLK